MLVTDSTGLSDTATITVTVNDVNERPVLTDQTFSVYENSPNDTLIGTVSYTHEDVGQTVSLSIIAGNEA
jgi:hypothetical protein